MIRIPLSGPLRSAAGSSAAAPFVPLPAWLPFAPFALALLIQ